MGVLTYCDCTWRNHCWHQVFWVRVLLAVWLNKSVTAPLISLGMLGQNVKALGWTAWLEWKDIPTNGSWVYTFEKLLRLIQITYSELTNMIYEKYCKNTQPNHFFSISIKYLNDNIIKTILNSFSIWFLLIIKIKKKLT